jgi:hypothetical protein
MDDLTHYGHDMKAYTPSKIVEVPGNSTETLSFQGPSSAAFGITRVLLGVDSPRDVHVKFETAGGDTKHWDYVIAKAVQRYFAGFSLRVPLLLPRAEKAIVSLKNTTAGAETVGVQLEGLHENPLQQRQEALGLSDEHNELSFFYATSEVEANQSLADLNVNYERSRDRAFDRFAVAADTDLPRDLRIRLVEANTAVRQLSTFEQVRRSFENGRRAPTPYRTEAFSSFGVEVTSTDGSAHDVSFFAASLPPSMLVK